MTSKRSSSPLAVKLLKATLSPIIFIAVLELVARMVGLKSGFFLIPRERNCMQRSSLLSLEFRPHCTANSRGTLIRTNALGLRSDEIRDDGSARILALGDSCTWGWRVPQSATYPAVLQRLLDEQPLTHHYQVINAGTPGHTTYQGLLYLRERGLTLKPDIVIIGYGFNDAAPTGDVETQLAWARRFYPLIRLDDTLLEYSQFYRWLRWTGQHEAPQWKPPRVAVDKYRRNLIEMVRLAHEHGAKVVLLSYARPGALQTRYLDTLAQVASALDVPLVRYDGPRIDLVHPTAAGYQLLADEILARLQREGYVQ